MAYPLVLRNARVDLIGPGVDATDEVLEAGGNIAAEVFRAHRAAGDQPVVLDDLAARNGFEVGENEIGEVGWSHGVEAGS